jgi:hypothetical protein
VEGQGSFKSGEAWEYIMKGKYGKYPLYWSEERRVRAPSDTAFFFEN